MNARRSLNGSEHRPRTRGTRALPALLGALLASACSDRDETELALEATAGRAGAEQDGAGLERAGAQGASDPSGPVDAETTPEVPRPEVPRPTGTGLDDSLGVDILGQRVFALIDQHCVSCHDELSDEAGVPGITRSAWLLSEGWVIPGNSGRSRLLLGFEDGHAQLEPGPTRGEIALVELYFDQNGFDGAECRVPDYLAPDAALALMARDIVTLPAGDRPFTRYLSVADVSNSGVCGWPLQEKREALLAAANGVSTAEALHAPVPIDPLELLFRVDVRHYGWDRGIDLDGDDDTDFLDGWSAIVATTGSFAAEYTGPEADVLKLEAQTPVPSLPVSAFVHAVGAGDLYYALLGVGRDLNAERLELGIDLFEDIADVGGSSLLWAGFFGSRGPDGDWREVTLNRAPQNRPDRAYWMAAEQETDDSESIYDTLFDWEPSDFQIIYNLPNGLQAYAIEVNGQRANEATIHRSCRGSCPDDAPLGLAACPACHEGGPLPIDNDVRDAIEQSDLGFYSMDELAEAREGYPTSAELDALVQADGAVHREARAAAGSIPDLPAAVSRVYYEFERTPLDARRAAAELGATFESWKAAVEELEPRLAALKLPEGRIDRATFAELFSDALCRLSVGARNRPVGCP